MNQQHQSQVFERTYSTLPSSESNIPSWMNVPESEWTIAKIHFRDPYAYQQKSYNCFSCEDVFGSSSSSSSSRGSKSPSSQSQTARKQMNPNTKTKVKATTPTKQQRAANTNGSTTCTEVVELYDNNGNLILEETLLEEVEVEQLPTCQCPTCGKSWHTEKQLRRHELTHLKKKFNCSFCTKAYTTKAGMNDHIAIVHCGERSFICSICSRTFTRSSLLFLHLKVAHHSDDFGKQPSTPGGSSSSNMRESCIKYVGNYGNKPAPTPTRETCIKTIGKTFSTLPSSQPNPSWMDVPESEWTNVKINFCDPYTYQYKTYNCLSCDDVLGVCSKSSSQIIRKQILQQLDDKNKKATSSPKQSKGGSVVLEEKEEAEQLPTIQCPTCGKSWHTEKQLRRHELVHMKKIYNCSYCNKTYKYYGAMTHHISAVHKL